MAFRILHLADLHLDRAFAAMGCQGDLARRRRQGLRDALRRAGTLAKERDCNVICIGGDLYEQERAGADTGRFLADTFASWQPLPVFLAPGNHDALLPQSLYARTEWSGNVHLFTSPTLEPCDLTDGITLWGLAHREPQWQGDPLAASPIDAGGIHLALFHGAELGSRPTDSPIHGPFHAAGIREHGFAAALCGHYHKRRLDTKTGLLYPGSPEPLSFDEPGGRGPAIAIITDSGMVEFEALDVNVWRALTVNAEVGGSASLDSLVDSALESIHTAAATLDPEHTLVRVDLTGDVAAAVSLDLVTVETRLREQTSLAVVRVRDLTRPGIDIEAAATERTARGAFTRTALEAMAGTDDLEESAILEDALRYGLMALSGAEVGLR